MIATRARKPSRGMTVVAVLVCLIIVTLISGAVLKVSVAHRELARSQERRLQAEWLAESGVDRAMARLAEDREFTGETWSLSDNDLGRSEQAPRGASPTPAVAPEAQITITVERVPAFANRRRVHVQADYPLDAPRRSRHSKEIMIDLEPSQAGAAP
jgi:type II secretory pathway pseudopilin PulG